MGVLLAAGKVTRYLFDRQDAKLVFFGRFVSVLRTYAAFLAGTTEMRWRRFLVANAAAGILRAAICTSVGYLAGHPLERLPLIIDPVIGGAAVLVIVVAVVLLHGGWPSWPSGPRALTSP